MVGEVRLPEGLIKLSDEQEALFSTTGNLKIQAYAGCGKSTALHQYILRNKKEKIVYTCYNRANNESFNDRCRLTNAQAVIKTFHGIAYSAIKPGEPKFSLPITLLKTCVGSELNAVPWKDRKFVTEHINKFISTYSSSACVHLADFDYLKAITSEGNTVEVSKYLDLITGMSSKVMDLMRTNKMPNTHDFYLKRFHESDKKIMYYNEFPDTILIDEAQDLSACMVSILENQSARKIYVGDKHQDIYEFRGSILAMETLPHQEIVFSASYRFGKTVAKGANHILKSKNVESSLKGAGPNTKVEGKAIISRTKIGVIEEAFELLFDRSKSTPKLYFEGGLDHYWIHEHHGIKISDIYDKWAGKEVHNSFINSFGNYEEIIEHAEKMNDRQLLNIIAFVRKHSKDVERLSKKLQAANVGADRKKADYILTNAHKSKGCEYSDVRIANDFIPLRQVARHASPVQEVNTLYTAFTRGANAVHVEEKILN